MFRRMINKALSYSSPSEVQLELNESLASSLITSALSQSDLFAGTVVRFPWGIDSSVYIKFSDSYEYILCENGTVLPYNLKKGDHILFVNAAAKETVQFKKNIFDSLISFAYGGRSKTCIDFNIKVSYTLENDAALKCELVNHYGTTYTRINSDIRKSIDDAVNQFFVVSPLKVSEDMSEKEAVDFYNSLFQVKNELKDHVLSLLHHQYSCFCFTVDVCDLKINDGGRLETYVNEIVDRHRRHFLAKIDLANSNELLIVKNEHRRKQAILDKENEEKLREYDRRCREKDAMFDLEIYKAKLETETHSQAELLQMKMKEGVLLETISAVKQVAQTNADLKAAYIGNNIGIDSEELAKTMRTIDDNSQSSSNVLAECIARIVGNNST